MKDLEDRTSNIFTQIVLCSSHLIFLKNIKYYIDKYSKYWCVILDNDFYVWETEKNILDNVLKKYKIILTYPSILYNAFENGIIKIENLELIYFDDFTKGYCNISV